MKTVRRSRDAYADREREIVEGIKRGLADIQAGRVVPHIEAMAEIDAAIAGAVAVRAKLNSKELPK